MESASKVLKILVIIVVLFLIISCRKDEPAMPVITTLEITGITYSTAVSGGESYRCRGVTLINRESAGAQSKSNNIKQPYNAGWKYRQVYQRYNQF
ncbi:MAG: hypothetical protein IPJ16_08285 [Bacteroidales bacterium]|nr:hypothetical protein [Bacteroidales bacterium]